MLRLLAVLCSVLAAFLWLWLAVGVLIASGNWFVSPADMGWDEGQARAPLLLLFAVALGVTLFARWLHRQVKR